MAAGHGLKKQPLDRLDARFGGLRRQIAPCAESRPPRPRVAASGCGSPGWRRESQKPARPRAGGRGPGARCAGWDRPPAVRASFASSRVNSSGAGVGAAARSDRALQPPHHDAQLAPIEFAGLVNGRESARGGKAPHVPLDLAAKFLLSARRGGRFGTAPAGERGPAQHALGTRRGNSAECSGAPARRRPGWCSGVTKGLPSRSVPTQEPKLRKGAGSGSVG